MGVSHKKPGDDELNERLDGTMGSFDGGLFSDILTFTEKNIDIMQHFKISYLTDPMAFLLWLWNLVSTDVQMLLNLLGFKF